MSNKFFCVSTDSSLFVIVLTFFIVFFHSGTGKTILAKAAACESEATFMNITPDVIAAKYTGEGEAAAAMIFEMAKQQKNCIIFFDECESFLRDRTSKKADHTASLCCAVMVQMAELTRKDNVLVVLASNLPWELDPAVHSRISSSVYVPLPSKSLLVFHAY